MRARNLTDYEQMSVSERILTLQDLWDEIAADPENVPVTDEQRAELDKRLSAHHERPGETSTWDDVKRRVQSKK